MEAINVWLSLSVLPMLLSAGGWLTTVGLDYHSIVPPTAGRWCAQQSRTNDSLTIHLSNLSGGHS
jgi:hypothetical protein